MKEKNVINNRAVFLDRDGTLCREMNYLARTSDFEPFADLAQLQRLKALGFLLIGVTNQSGIARGLMTEEFVKEINSYFTREHGFDAFYYCPHHPDEGCECRKPRTGMLIRAEKELGVRLPGSYMVGDRELDMITARSAGMKAILVRTGFEQESVQADFCAGTLRDAVDYIIKTEEGKQGGR